MFLFPYLVRPERKSFGWLLGRAYKRKIAYDAVRIAASKMNVEVNDLSHEPTELYNRISVKKEWKKHFKILKPLKYETKKQANHLRFVCISDTHNKTDEMQLPEGDILLHAGDFTQVGAPSEVEHFISFLDRVRPSFQQIVVIAGNHDLTFDTDNYSSIDVAAMFHKGKTFDLKAIKSSLQQKCTYLEDNGTEIAGIKVYGTPWQPEFGGWGFNLRRGPDCLEKWRKIPDDIEILITHEPPLGHGDKCQSGARAGCAELLSTIQSRVKPKYHIFGHIHEGYGITTDGVTTYINASSVNLGYRQVNDPIIFDMPIKSM
ncbi:LOW QUALITY PROTEIN: metallophosphoesterase MPPED2-like [Rhopilema esculentum]|uniref:LOW QUALITY PROTEIN: metallophosphoesterase MPPED2-like n=1 Tax=Rhopilema esculentum TaxID=499914 RepID=UPI0031DBCCBC